MQDWLTTHGFSPFIKEITSDKPRAEYYIDDKAVKFENWENTLREIDNRKIS